MLIYTCISSHGFGHGSRTAAVLAELHRLRPSWRLVISTGLPASFLATALGPVPYELRPCRWDVGVIQADALSSDPLATLAALEQLELDLPEQLAREAAWLQEQGQPLLVLADVPPAAALLAPPLGAPLVWLASFGWEAIYGAMGPSFEPWAARALELYRRGDLLLRCPLAMPIHWGIPERQIGLTAGRPRCDVQQLATRLQLPPRRERCVLISFGGLGAALDPALLGRWPEHLFIGHDPILASMPNGRLLPEGVRPLEVMPLCERMITKPGYSSFCEAFSADVGIHLVHREGFAEAAVLEKALQRHGRHRLLSQAQFQAADWQLDLPLQPASQGAIRGGGSAEAANEIVNFAQERFGRQFH